jgi:hypothetical protein
VILATTEVKLVGCVSSAMKHVRSVLEGWLPSAKDVWMGISYLMIRSVWHVMLSVQHVQVHPLINVRPVKIPTS